MLKKVNLSLLSFLGIFSLFAQEDKRNITVYETSESGHQLTEISSFSTSTQPSSLYINQNKRLQTISGFGGAFTEASASLLNQLGGENREKILRAYFAKEGANYSLARTHMNSCDFSLSNYSYTPVENDLNLEHFSVKEDQDDLIPMIKEAMAISEDGFRLFASPWTAAPWMKDNNSWVGGKLLPKYYDTWALFFSKYVDAYKAEGINIWGFTVENEPHGNGNNWESMIYSPEEMTNFVQNHLGPKLEADGKGDLVILGYDQNREGLNEWVDAMYKNESTAKYFDGTAIHWYESTYDFFPKALQYAHEKAPNKYLIQTEACVDDEIPVWKDDAWYWKKEATDWGYKWREEEKKYLHPKYAPVNRYARDIIGCLNNWVDGWVDWNMVLDKQGGPNWKKNWCIAPVIVDPEKDEVYFTPLYYVMAHFSKFIRPGAKIIDVLNSDPSLMVAAAENPDTSISVVIFNEGKTEKSYTLELGEYKKIISIEAQAIQTVVIN
ncbi:glycosyl hydrolase family 30 [Flavobacteriaceae bacterium]|nr:glycosyl hydrolase family 30 [Flavobacteriaceae bacterium]MDB4118329.1 glycosyl hydrolase family 30 [Flavobacteriaceae bacterium]MDB9821155.1 glycosyl hydrolase family 30 [Flavobacteriaceae bacterium]